GPLVAANNSALGTATGSTTVNAGATLGLQGGITVTGELGNLAAATSASTASFANLSGNNTWTGNLSLTGAVANDQVKVDVAGGSQLTVSGVISEATNAKVVAKTGSGTLLLTGTNTYNGSTNIAAGTLIAGSNAALGSATAGTSVQIGATLGVQNNVTIASGETFSLYGTAAPPAAPSIKNIQDNNTLNGNISLIGGVNTGVAIDSNTGNLTLNGAITQAANANYVQKTGAGTVTLGGTTANTFSGGFFINDGTAVATKTAGIDATGAAAVNIGDGIGAAASAILQLNASNQINNASSVTIATDGRLDLQANNDSIGALTMTGGNVQGTGTLTLGNNLTFNGVGSSTATISANLDLGTSGTRVIQVGNNGVNGDTDLTISGAISGGTASFNKTDLGTLQLTGTTANTFSGGVYLNAGRLNVN
ncbi:MAG: autotransporter-associated beta strand repeat-containing protein, partial [Bacteroidota bacterium]